MTDAVHKRTYGLSSSRVPFRSTPMERPFTPSEELSSWLPDEMCAACGAPVGIAQLYCSDACRDEDHKRLDCAPDQSESHTSPSNTAFASACAAPSKSAPPSAHASVPPVLAATNADADFDLRFRYPCPPSPHLIAQRRTANFPASDSLNAFEKSLLNQRTLSRSNRRPDSDASSAGESNISAPSVRRRNSSDSTTSSTASSSAVLTDPSTPSPAMAADRDFSDKDDEELNASDFYLPPSITPPTAIIMTRGSSRHSGRDVSSISQAPISAREPRPATMSYARRPSSTNLPAPVLYSPALLARNKRNSFVSQENAQATITGRTRTSRASVFGHLSRPDQGTPAGGPSAIDALTAAASTSIKRSKSDEAHPQLSSPQQSSGSSSATRTLCAQSPASLSSARDVCGRPGCLGASSNREMLLLDSKPSSITSRHTVAGRRAASGSTKASQDNDRPVSRHKHTHSAKGGLSIYDHFASVASRGLLMTPAKTDAFEVSNTVVSDNAEKQDPPADESCEAESHVEDEQAGSFHPRGRSKARGPRSSSRRGRSPPRAAARGVSQALRTEEGDRKPVGSRSPPLEAVRPRSTPINISRRGSNHSDSSSESSCPSSDDEAGSAPRRGRSPVDRRRDPSALRSRSRATNKDRIGNDERRRPGLATAQSDNDTPQQEVAAGPDPGFDDVEDLEMDP